MTPEKDRYAPTEAKELEDKILKLAADLNNAERATLYWVLNRSYRITIDSALALRRKKKLAG